MLTIVYGEVDEAISDPDTYFNHTYSKNGLMTLLLRR